MTIAVFPNLGDEDTCFFKSGCIGRVWTVWNHPLPPVVQLKGETDTEKACAVREEESEESTASGNLAR